ncbi:MAG: hypothetical protein VX951_07005 [Planctomycetota bacterium]|nr:hypothetical protein [Planctomycetota bacterium]
MNLRITTLVLCTGGFAVPIVAQSVAQNPELMALTGTSPLVLRQHTTAVDCRPTACSLGATLAGSGAALAGGAAWDGRQGRLWVSNGRQLTLAGVRGTERCSVQCQPFLAPLLTGTTTTRVTGLAYLAGGMSPGHPAGDGVLFLSYSNQYLAWASSRGCTLSKVTGYSMLRTLGPNRAIGGLAVDALRGFLFMATSKTGTASPTNIIFVSRADQPGVPFCRFGIVVDSAKCLNVRLGPISGLAYDVSNRQLYVTDGRTLVYGKLSLTQSTTGWVCRFAHSGCCTNLSSEPLVGLAMAPPASLNVGRPCAVGGCAPCANMRSGSIGDAVLGNPAFQLTLDNAPTNFRMALLGIGFGPCGATGFDLGLCGVVRIAIAPFRPLILPIPGSGTGGGCNGAVRLPLPVPVDEALLNVQLSTQWVLLCPNNGNGTSNCLQLRISG